jgi:hypothetical protein
MIWSLQILGHFCYIDPTKDCHDICMFTQRNKMDMFCMKHRFKVRRAMYRWQLFKLSVKYFPFGQKTNKIVTSVARKETAKLK